MASIEAFHRVKFSGQLTLKKRLLEVFATIPTDLLKVVKFTNVAAVVDQLVIDRNYLTHYPANLKPKTSDTNALWVLGKGIQVLLEYLLLKEAAVPDGLVLKQ